MNAVLDDFLVGVLLLLSVGYAVYKLGPRTLKRRMLQTLSRATAAAPGFLRLGRVAQKFEAASSGSVPGACGGCDNCGTESSSGPPPSSGEIKIPVAKIRRRTSAL